MRRLLLAATVACASVPCLAEGPTRVLQVTPASGSPVDCYNVPVGTKGELVFELPVPVKAIAGARLAMMVDDIDAPAEATIRLNGKKLEIPKDAIAEGPFHAAMLVVPVKQLRDGRNVFEFTLDSTLGGSTLGYLIEESYLMLTVPKALAVEAAKRDGVRMRAESAAKDVRHGKGEPVFEVTGEKKLAEGFEIPCPFLFASIAEAKNGDLLLMYGDEVVRSSDGGRTWTKPEKLPIGINGIVRLRSGKLGARMGMVFHVSDDDGKTWEKRGDIAAAASGREGDFPRWIGQGAPHYDVLMQTKSGRIFLPARGSASANRWLALRSAARGVHLGERKPIEGHAHRPEADYTIVYYSDDEGKTWSRAEGTIMVWKDDGFGGMWPCDEPNIIELTNGDVMLYFRTTLGRVYTARSGNVAFTIPTGREKGKVIKGAPGEYFDYPRPTDLSGSYTPCRIRRIPSTGDLLLVWNQVSADEMRGGHSRGRLSSAISRDDGKTWKHFRTIDRQILPPAGRVAPEPKPAMARALKFVGELPDNWGHVDYPNVGFCKDTVIITWLRGIQKPAPNEFSGSRLRVLPVSWFYQDEQPYVPPQPTPKLLIGDPGVEVKSLFIDGGFLVDLTDVAKALGRKVNANMFCTIHQALTHLGEKPVYHRDKMNDNTNPLLRVTFRGR